MLLLSANGGLQVFHCGVARMRQRLQRSKQGMRRCRPVQKRAETFDCELLHALLLCSGKPFQATREIIRNLDRHLIIVSNSCLHRFAKLANAADSSSNTSKVL